jgi:hypothetical protein
MMAQVYLSHEPCFQCKTKEKTVRMRSGETSLVLCLEHLYPQLTEKPKQEKKPTAPKAEKK